MGKLWTVLCVRVHCTRALLRTHINTQKTCQKKGGLNLHKKKCSIAYLLLWHIYSIAYLSQHITAHHITYRGVEGSKYRATWTMPPPIRRVEIAGRGLGALLTPVLVLPAGYNSLNHSVCVRSICRLLPSYWCTTARTAVEICF